MAPQEPVESSAGSDELSGVAIWGAAQIVVLGMHRSGTSALTGALNAMGAYVGNDDALTGKNWENPVGFFERRDTRAICDAILHGSNADWWKIAHFDHGQVPHDVTQRQLRAFSAVVSGLDEAVKDRAGAEGGVEPSPPFAWAIKEPRLCFLFPILRRALIRPVIVKIVRHPIEVARSLRLRNGFTIEAGLALWEAYVCAALRNTDDMSPVLIRYSDLIASPKETLTDLAGRMTQLGVNGLDADAGARVIQSTLRHENLSDANADDRLTDSQRRLWQAVNDGLLTEVPELSSDARRTLIEFQTDEGTRQNQKAEIDALNKKMKAALDKAAGDDAAAKAKARLPGLEKELTAARQAQSVMLQRCTRAEEALREKTKFSDELHTTIIKRDAALSALEKELGAHRVEMQELTRLKSACEQTISGLENALDRERKKARSAEATVLKKAGAAEAMERQLSGRTAKVETLGGEIASLKIELKNLRATLNARSQQEKDLRTEISRHVREISQLQRTFRWRLGGVMLAPLAPLRFAKNLPQRRRHSRDVSEVTRSGLFDQDAYLEANPDIAAVGIDPVSHYLTSGWREGREPSRQFDANWYLSEYDDIARSDMNPLLHYIRFGKSEGRLACAPERGRLTTNKFGTKSKNTKTDSKGGTVKPSERQTENSLLSDADREKYKIFQQKTSQYYKANKHAIDNTKVSIVMPSFNREVLIEKAIRSVLAQSHQNWELLVTDDGSTDETVPVVRRFTSDQRISVDVIPHAGVSAARNASLDRATGQVIAYLDSDNSWRPNYLRDMLAFMASNDLECAYSSVAIRDDDDALILLRGQEFNWDKCLSGNYIDLNVYCHRRSLLDDVGNFDEALQRTVDWDLILRHTRDHRTDHAAFIGADYRHAVNDTSRISVSHAYAYRKIVKTKNDGPRGKTLQDVANEIALSIAIKIPAPREKKDEWGDYHFANSLADSIRRHGHTVHIDFLGEWYERDTREEDVAIVIRGLTSYEARPGQVQIMWNISHPDQVSFAEYDQFDVVYVASLSYHRFLDQICDTRVVPLLQATDTTRFNLENASETKMYDALFVGNSRNEFRPIVQWALTADLKLSVFGTRWSQYIDDQYIVGENVTNEKLGEFYGGAQIVLNDHWPSMREFGFLSNRLFDVAATGSRLVSDVVPSMKQVFGDTVAQVASPDDLRQIKNDLHGDNKADFDERRRLARYIAKEHSFDQRAAVILSDVLRHLGLPPSEKIPADTNAKTVAHRATDVDNDGPYINRRTPLRVNGIVRWDREFPQSSSFLRLLCPLTSECIAADVDFQLIPARQWRDARSADVTILQRTALSGLAEAEEFTRAVAQSASRLVADTDDAFKLIDERHPQYDLYRDLNSTFSHIASHAEEVWVSNSQLADLYHHDAKAFRVVPNCLDPRIWRDYRKPKVGIGRREKVEIVYMGTATHDADFEIVLQSLDQLADEKPDSFVLTLIGAVTNPPTRSWLRKETIPASAQGYPRFVRWLRDSAQFDVGIAPLADTPFNACKSDLKFLDYTAIGALTIASRVAPYAETLQDESMALLANNTTADWLRVLRMVVLDVAEYRPLLARAEAYLWEKRTVEMMSQQQQQCLLA